MVITKLEHKIISCTYYKSDIRIKIALFAVIWKNMDDCQLQQPLSINLAWYHHSAFATIII